MSTLLVFLLPLAGIVWTIVWAEWRLSTFVAHAPLSDLLSCTAAFCAATAWLFAVILVTGDAGGQMDAALLLAARMAAALTIVAAPFACLLIAIRPWPKKEP